MLPSLASLGKICNAFDMTMAQFLAEDAALTEITAEEKNLLKKWELLSPQQKDSFLSLMDWGQIHYQLEIYFEERLSGRNL